MTKYIYNSFIKNCLVLLLSIEPIYIYAQHPQDSLQEVLPSADVVSKNYKANETGVKSTQPDSVLRFLNHYKDLSDILSLSTTAYLKNYGNGALATLSFRGTGPEHTNVLWNGFQLNSMAYGLTDLSNLSSNMGEKMTVLSGGNATSAGSGAIGGSVMLDQSFDKRNQASIATNLNSIGTYTMGVNANYSYGMYTLNMGYVLREINNYYHYTNPYILGNPQQKMPYCPSKKETNTYSLMVKPNDHFSLKIFGLSNTYKIHIQPPKGIDTFQGTREGYNNVDGMHLDFKTKWGITQIKSGHLYQEETYNGAPANNEYSVMKFQQWQNSIDHFFNHVKGMHRFSVSFEHQYIIGEQTQYSGKHREQRAAVMIKYKVNPFRKLHISAHIREQFYSLSKPFFSPFLGIQYLLKQKKSYIWNLKATATRGFRLPTFNERYYVPGGNMGIKPERTQQAEVGIQFKTCHKKVNHTLEFTTYYNHILDRVVWVNQSSPVFPEALNLKETQISGVELEYSFEKSWRKFKLKAVAQLAYVASRNVMKDPLNLNKTLYRQMIYIPPVRANGVLEIKYKKTSLLYTFQYSDVRYTNLDNTDWLNPYTLHNLYIQQQVKFWRLDMSMMLKWVNVSNINYETLQNYTLPRRYVESSIMISIK